MIIRRIQISLILLGSLLKNDRATFEDVLIIIFKYIKPNVQYIYNTNPQLALNNNLFI